MIVTLCIVTKLNSNLLGLTRWSEGTNEWPDSACKPSNPFGLCNSNDAVHGNAWAKFVCTKNG